MSPEDNMETLFSFELLVECVRIERDTKVSDQLALGVRLLDFPTLLIYQPQQSSSDTNHEEHRGEDQRGQHVFNRGKSCFFKMNLNSLHTQLSSSPLYAMVLDVKEEIPKLVGTSLISLAKVMDRINQDVTERGSSAASSHGERGLVGLCNLTGERIGSISLSYKILSLGVSLLPHITDSRGLKSVNAQRGQESITEQNISAELLPHDRGNVFSPPLDIPKNKPSNENTSIDEEKQDNSKHKPRYQTSQTLKDTEDSFEEDVTTFCPPHLFYTKSAEEKSKNGDYKLLNLDSEAFTFEDTLSEEEMAENQIEDTSSPMTNRRVTPGVRTSPSGATQNPLGEALQRLPLLNALLVELSHLNDQNPQQSLSVHPNLAWIYRPASAEPSGQKARTKSSVGRQLKLAHPPRNCSTPVSTPAKDRREEGLIESRSSGTSPRKKLVYGTTKTFTLRLKQVSPLKAKRRECVELMQSETRSGAAKGKTKSRHKIMKAGKRKSALNQSSSLNENIETMIQSITVDSAQQDTITLKQTIHAKQDKRSPGISENPSLSDRGLKCIHIPSVDSDSFPRNKDKKEHHSESNQSQCESDRHTEKIESQRSSRHSSPKSSFSASSGEGNEEADYADDFNSLEPSDASPDPASSPEPSRSKTPGSPPWSPTRSPTRSHPRSPPVLGDFCNSDSGSEGFRRRAAVLPVPVKAPGSPQRALRGTHVIRPHNRASALSFSDDDDGNRDGSASVETVRPRKQVTESGRAERSSGADSFISSRGQRSESSRNSGLVLGFSAESISSLEPQEVEELEDELGSLDFRKEYQHISKLVSNKLPGYTM